MWSLLLLATVVTAKELPTPANLLGPRHFNHHAQQYLKEVETEPTKQGPVLFPNDAPPPPRPPLIVTSRPLIESIARSELNPDPPQINNSIASQSQINRVSFKPNYLDYLKENFLQPEPNFLVDKPKPNFLARVKDYKPYIGPGALNFGAYGDGKKNLVAVGDNGYSYYNEEQTALPPIYRAFADHAKQKVSNIKHKTPKHQNYHVKDRRHDHGSDYDDDGSNYAFSYRVKDHNTGDDFSHTQQSSGSATNGEYRVRLPDGRMQIVSYTADENGYKADVRYDDEDKTNENRIDNYDYKFKQNYDQNKYHYDAKKQHYDSNKQHYDTNINYDQNKHHYDQNIDNYDHLVHDYGQYGQNTRDYSDVNHDYVQNRNYKPVEENYKSKEDFSQYTDLSKEIMDYSAEYDGKHGNYEPHKSKFSSLVDTQGTIGTIVVPNFNPKSFPSSTVKPSYAELKPLFVTKKSHNYVSSTTVRPSYEELKPLFITKKVYNSQPTYNPVEIHVPSTTPSANFEGTTEHVVVIGAKPLYTNIKDIPGVTPSPVTFSQQSNFVTPRSYLVSTINSLKNGEKPILSNSFINRINKYLSFN